MFDQNILLISAYRLCYRSIESDPIDPIPVEEIGSPARARTRDPLINSQLLYQLSYRGIEVAYTK